MVWKTLTLAQDLTQSTRSQRVRLGMERARKRGVTIGRPRLRNGRKIQRLSKLSVREIARIVGCSKSHVQRALAREAA